MGWRRGIFVLVVLVGMGALGTLQAQPPGAAIFASNCATCHGADGRGGEHAPNIATAPEVQHLMDRELAGIIRYGIAGAGMPAFSSLKQQEVADVVSYLRFLQGRGDVVMIPGDPKRGEALFYGKAQCSGCHMVNGKGGFIGNDLSFYGVEAKPDQMRAIILDPEKNLPADEKATTVVTTAGQTITGMLRTNNNFSLSLQTLDGSFHFLPKSELIKVEAGSHSLMPAATLNSKEVDDLVSYLLRVGEESVQRSPAAPRRLTIMTIKILTAFLAIATFAGLQPLSAQTSGFKVIQPPGADTAYSAGILANGTLYVSGQGSSARDFTSQASEAMHKVQTVLRAAGMDLRTSFGSISI